MNLNVGNGDNPPVAPLLLDPDMHVDSNKNLPGFTDCRDLTPSPFRNDFLGKGYCSYVLKHMEHPIEGLKEPIRACTDVGEIRVSHWPSVGRSMKLPNGKVIGYLSSFRCGWFHSLNYLMYCVEMRYKFPGRNSHSCLGVSAFTQAFFKRGILRAR